MRRRPRCDARDDGGERSRVDDASDTLRPTGDDDDLVFEIQLRCILRSTNRIYCVAAYADIGISVTSYLGRFRDLCG